MRYFLARLLPFIYLGIVIVLFIAGIILISHLLILGAIVGLILYAFAFIKEKIFPSKNLTQSSQKTGRTFDQRDDQ